MILAVPLPLRRLEPLSLRRISDARRTEEGGLGSAGGGNERVGGDWSEGGERRVVVAMAMVGRRMGLSLGWKRGRSSEVKGLGGGGVG